MELTPIGSILRSLWFLVACLAIGVASYFIYRARGWKRKGVWAVIILGLFGVFPLKNWIKEREQASYAREAWAHFKKLCDEKSGEKIYRQQTGIRSVVVTKALPPAKESDLYDQFWDGDPYSASATSQRSIHAAGKLVYQNAPLSRNTAGTGFDFVEFDVGSIAGSKTGVLHVAYDSLKRDYSVKEISKAVSRFSLKWEDISTQRDREYWVAGSRLSVIDLSDNRVVAERVGFFIEAGFGSTAGNRRPWLASKGATTTCPEAHDWADRWFVIKALRPHGG